VVRLPTGEFMQIANNYRRARGLFEQRIEAAQFRRSLIDAWLCLSDEQKSGAFPWDQALIVGAIMRERAASFIDIAGSRIVRAVLAAHLRRVDEDNIDVRPIRLPIEPLIATVGRFAFALSASGVTATVVKQPKFEAEFGYGRNEMRLASKAIQTYAGEFGESLSTLVTSAVKQARLRSDWLSGKEALAGVYAIVVGADAEVKSCRVLEAPRIIGDTQVAYDRRKWRHGQVRTPAAFGESERSALSFIPTGGQAAFQMVPLEDYCSQIRSFAWQDREWLQAVTNAAWRQAHTLRNYTLPRAHISFPFQRSFAEAIGVHSLRFLEETEDRVTIRFDIPRDRYAKLVLNRRRNPKLGDSPAQALLTAVAVTVYRDCVVVADNKIRLGIELVPITTSPSGVQKPYGARQPKPITVPRVRTASVLTATGRTRFDARSHSVVGHLRRLPDQWSASADQIAEAMRFGLVLSPGQTFVRPHERGNPMSAKDQERTARSRYLSTELLGMLHHGVTAL